MSYNGEKQGSHKSVINWYPGHMAKTKRQIKENINVIDIIYELIDARLPISSKIRNIEDIIKRSNYEIYNYKNVNKLMKENNLINN